ncbi:MAG: hypothetical protein JWM68_337 [Verrucomicrobiales bacterium]|nr:hypothetical protein [Verrucomicrobiales bacterium]
MAVPTRSRVAGQIHSSSPQSHFLEPGRRFFYPKPLLRVPEDRFWVQRRISGLRKNGSASKSAFSNSGKRFFGQKTFFRKSERQLSTQNRGSGSRKGGFGIKIGFLRGGNRLWRTDTGFQEPEGDYLRPFGIKDGVFYVSSSSTGKKASRKKVKLF